jgi:hypothetical protein
METKARTSASRKSAKPAIIKTSAPAKRSNPDKRKITFLDDYEGFDPKNIIIEPAFCRTSAGPNPVKYWTLGMSKYVFNANRPEGSYFELEMPPTLVKNGVTSKKDKPTDNRLIFTIDETDPSQARFKEIIDQICERAWKAAYTEKAKTKTNIDRKDPYRTFKKPIYFAEDANSGGEALDSDGSEEEGEQNEKVDDSPKEGTYLMIGNLNDYSFVDKKTGKRTNIKTEFRLGDSTCKWDDLRRKKLTVTPILRFAWIYCGANSCSIKFNVVSAIVNDIDETEQFDRQADTQEYFRRNNPDQVKTVQAKMELLKLKMAAQQQAKEPVDYSKIVSSGKSIVAEIDASDSESEEVEGGDASEEDLISMTDTSKLLK